MAKYGLFQAAGKAPIQEYEGDSMVQNGEYVMIYKAPRNDNEVQRQVAAIRLDRNQSVREI
jgi:hypothetical protein